MGITMQLDKAYRKRSAILAIILVLSYYLSQYNSFIPGTTIGELVLILGSIDILIFNGFKLRISANKAFLCFYLISLSLSIITLLSSPSSFTMASPIVVLTRWIRYFAYVLFAVLYWDNFLMDRNNAIVLINVYRIVACFMAVYGILQFLMFVSLHYYLPVDILPFSMSRDVSIETLISNVSKSYMRASALFAEPGYYAKFLIPGVIFSILGWDGKKLNVKDLVLFSIAIVLSGSVQGIILMLFTYILALYVKRSINLQWMLGLNSIIVLFVIVLLFGDSWGLQNNPIQRVFNLFGGAAMDYSTRIRVYRGAAVWGKLPLVQKLIGVGLGNIANYTSEHNITTIYDYFRRNEATLDYMNGISSILCSSGIIGLFSFVFLISSYMKHLDVHGSAMIILLVISLFGGGGVFTIISVLYICLAFAYTYAIKDADFIGMYTK